MSSLWDTVAGWFSSNGSDNKAASSAFDNGQVASNAAMFGNPRSAAVRAYNEAHPYKGFLNPVHDATTAVAKTIAAPINDYVIKPLGWTINEADRGLATATLYTDANDSTGGSGFGDWIGFNPNAWKAAWGASKHTNVGQAVLWETDIKNDPANQGASFFSQQGQDTYQKQINNSWAGRIVSGGIDVVATWYADPTLVLAKGVKIAHAASDIHDYSQAEDVFNEATKLNTGETAERARTPLRVVSKGGQGIFSKGAEEAGWREFQLVKSWDNGANQAGRQVLLARTPETAPIMSLLDMADKIPELDHQRQAKLAILGAARDSDSARKWLTENVPDIARAHERAMLAPEGREALDSLNEALAGRKFGSYSFQAAAQTWVSATESFGTEANRAEISALHTRTLKTIHDQFDGLDQIAGSMPLETAGATALDRLKAGLRNHIAEDFHYQDSMSGRTIRLLHWAANQRFRGTIAVDHAIRGNQELMDWMTRAKIVHPDSGDKVSLFTGAERAAASRQFLTATSQEQRRRQVDALWDNMYTKIAGIHGMDVDAIKDVVNADKKLRQGAIQYTTRELEKARLAGDDFVTLEDPQGTPTRLRAALLSTHITNNAHLPDPEEVLRKVRQDISGPTTKDAVTQRYHSLVNGLDTYNNMWRIAVLGRPGILIRTQLDSQARALAVMRGTAYVHSAMEGLGHYIGKKLNAEQWAQVDARASDIQEAERLSDEAERLHSTADVRARITKQRQGRVEKAVTTPTLQSRAYILQGAEKDTTLPLDADAIANMSTPALRARAEANLAAAAALRERKYDALPLEQGSLDETIDLGDGRSITTRLAKSAQDKRDLRSAAYKGGRPSEHLLVRSMGGRDALNNAHSREMRRLFEDHGRFKTYEPGDRYWAAGWIRAWDSLRNSHTVERILDLPDVGTRDLIHTLRDDPMVRKEFDEVRDDNLNDLNAWLARVTNTVAWLAPTHEVRSALVSKGHMQIHEVEDMFAKYGDTESQLPQRMHVQGPIFTKRPPEGVKHRDFVGAFFRKLMDEPDLKGARHPVMVERYRQHITDLATRELDRTGEQALTATAQARIERIAKHRAIQDTQQTFYDTAKFTGAHNSLRFASPFLGAWQDAMESWARLFYDDPARAGAFYKMWNVPNRLGLVVDQNGDAVRPGQQADQSYLVLPIQFGKSFKDTKKLTFRKDSLNSIFQGAQWYTPGTGPVIQVPLQEVIARTFPEIGNMNNPLVKTLLPFGTPKVGNPLSDFAKASLPAYVKAFLSMRDPSDPNNARAYLMSVNEQIINARKAGKPLPSAAELDRHAKSAARSAGFIRGITLWGLGVSGDQTGPVDFYKRKYDQLQSQASQLHAAGTTPSEEFVKQFPEAAGLKWSVSQTKTGVNATVKAFEAERAYKKQIAANPDFGWFYVGADNLTGDFSQSIYNAQSSRDIGLGGEGTERHMLNRRQLIDATLSEDGWRKYSAIQAMVQQQLKLQGLHSIQQNDAGAIKAAKDAMVNALRTDNPSWAKDYDSQDTNKLQQFLDNIAAPALKDASLKNRPDIKALGAYINMRDMAIKFLTDRGLSLGSSDAKPIVAALEEAGSALAANNIGFEQIWTRVLGREVDTSNDNATQEGAA